MHPPDSLPSDLREWLSYDPETGIFTWQKDRRRVRAGDEAGTITAGGYHALTLDGTTFYGHYLAWFFVHGTWPTGVPLFRDGDRSNTAIGNIHFTPRSYSTDAKAVRARKWRDRKNAGVAARRAGKTSPIPDIEWSAARGEWLVHIPGGDNLVAYHEKDFKVAASRYFEHLKGRDFVRAYAGPPAAESDLSTFAGDRTAISRVEALSWLAYDKDSGAFYHRQRHSRAAQRPPKAATLYVLEGARADVLNTNGTPVIKLFGRDYPAASMAIFIETGVWPKRRTVKHLDGDKTNNAWANLEVIDAARA